MNLSSAHVANVKNEMFPRYLRSSDAVLLHLESICTRHRSENGDS